MKTWPMLVAVEVMALSANLVLAEDAPHKAPMVKGKITKIDGVNITVQPNTPKEAPAGAAAPDPKTFATDDKTVVTVGKMDGDKKTVADLAVDKVILVKLSDDGKTAVNIVIDPVAKGPKKDGGKKDGGAKEGSTK